LLAGSASLLKAFVISAVLFRNFVMVTHRGFCLGLTRSLVFSGQRQTAGSEAVYNRQVIHLHVAGLRKTRVFSKKKKRLFSKKTTHLFFWVKKTTFFLFLFKRSKILFFSTENRITPF